jgi:hypothetical protein
MSHLERLIRRHGGRLIRQGRHRVYLFDGQLLNLHAAARSPAAPSTPSPPGFARSCAAVRVCQPMRGRTTEHHHQALHQAGDRSDNALITGAGPGGDARG